MCTREILVGSLTSSSQASLSQNLRVLLEAKYIYLHVMLSSIFLSALSLILLFLFFDCKYYLHLLLFSLIVMASPTKFLWVVSGLGVQGWLKRYLHAATRVSMLPPFSLFVFSFSSLHYDTFMFFIPSARSLRFVLPIILLIFTDIFAAHSKILTLGQLYPTTYY